MRPTRPTLLTAPALAVILVLFVGGFLLGLAESLEPRGGSSFLGAYGRLIGDSRFLGALGLTLWFSTAATILTIVLAILTALALRSRFPGRRILTFLYQIPLTIPHLVAALGILMLLSQGGILSRVTAAAGLTRSPGDFPLLISDPLGIGIILVYLWKQIPFLGLIILSILKSLGENYEDQARTLGASPVQTFRKVTLPLILPGLVPGSILCFAYTFGAFEVPYLLGRPHPAALSVLTYRLFEDSDLGTRPRAMAAAVIMTLLIFFLVLAYKKVAVRLTSSGSRR